MNRLKIVRELNIETQLWMLRTVNPKMSRRLLVKLHSWSFPHRIEPAIYYLLCNRLYCRKHLLFLRRLYWCDTHIHSFLSLTPMPDASLAHSRHGRRPRSPRARRLFGELLQSGQFSLIVGSTLQICRSRTKFN